MDIGLLLSNIGVSLSVILGCLAIFKPKMIQTFVGIQAVSLEGESEVKATYGGFFVGISVYALVVQLPTVFVVIGVGWLAAAAVRLVSAFSNSFSARNMGAVVFEGLIGVLCISSLFDGAIM
jgi:hypothetical protein